MQLPGQLASGFRAPPRGGSRETLIFGKLVFPGKPGPGNRGAALTLVLWCIGA